MSTTPPSTGTKGRWADLDRRSKEEETKSIQRWKNDPSGGNVPSANRTPLHRLVASWRSASSSSSKEVEDLRSKDRCTQRIGALPVSPSLRMGFSLTIDHARGLPRLGPGFHNRFRAIGCGPHPVGSIRHPESEDGAEGVVGKSCFPVGSAELSLPAISTSLGLEPDQRHRQSGERGRIFTIRASLPLPRPYRTTTGSVPSRPLDTPTKDKTRGGRNQAANQPTTSAANRANAKKHA